MPVLAARARLVSFTWGPNQLTLPAEGVVREYLREQATRADKNSLDMNVLAHLGPQNLEEAWAYFTIVSTGSRVAYSSLIRSHPNAQPVKRVCIDKYTLRTYNIVVTNEFDPKRKPRKGVGESMYSGFTHNPHHLSFGLSGKTFTRVV